MDLMRQITNRTALTTDGSSGLGAHLTPRRPRRPVTAISERVTHHVLDVSMPPSNPENTSSMKQRLDEPS